MQKKPSLLSAKFKKQQKNKIESVKIEDPYANLSDEELAEMDAENKEFEKKIFEEDEKQLDKELDDVIEKEKELTKNIDNEREIYLESIGILETKAQEYEREYGKRVIYNGKITNGFFSWYINHVEIDDLKWINADKLSNDKMKISLKHKLKIKQGLTDKVAELKEHKEPSKESKELAEKLTKEVQKHLSPAKELKKYHETQESYAAFLWILLENRMDFKEGYNAPDYVIEMLEKIESKLSKNRLNDFEQYIKEGKI
jgi:hypothetical protein